MLCSVAIAIATVVVAIAFLNHMFWGIYVVWWMLSMLCNVVIDAAVAVAFHESHR